MTRTLIAIRFPYYSLTLFPLFFFFRTDGGDGGARAFPIFFFSYYFFLIIVDGFIFSSSFFLHLSFTIEIEYSYGHSSVQLFCSFAIVVPLNNGISFKKQLHTYVTFVCVCVWCFFDTLYVQLLKYHCTDLCNEMLLAAILWYYLHVEGQQKHFSNTEECRGKREIWAKEAEKNRNFYKHSIFDFIHRSMVHEPRSSFCAACRWSRNWFNRGEKKNLTKLRFSHACSLKHVS